MGNGYRRQIIALTIGYAIWGIFWGAWGALLPAVQLASHASDAQLGSVLLFVAVGALPAMTLVGPLVDRFGSKTLVVSIALFAISIMMLSRVHSLLSLALVLLFVGATSGAVDVSLNSGVALLEAISGKKLFNKLTAAFPLAVVFASPLAGIGRELHVSLQFMFLTIATMVLFGALLNIGAHKKTWKNEISNFKFSFIPKISITKILIVLGLVAAGIHVVEVAVEQWSTIYIENSLYGTPAIAALGPAVYMGMLFVGRMVAHIFSNKLSDRKILVLTGLSATIGMALAAISTSSLGALTGFALAGFGMASGIPTIFSLTGRSVSSEKRGRAISSVTTIGYLGYLISPPLIGVLAGLFTLRASWAILSIFAFIVVLIFVFIKKSVKNEKADS